MKFISKVKLKNLDFNFVSYLQQEGLIRPNSVNFTKKIKKMKDIT
jgi:hypothetical protein